MFTKRRFIVFITMVIVAISSCDSEEGAKFKLGFETFDFGDVALRSKDTVQLTIENTTNKMYNVSGFRLSGTHAADFAVLGGGTFMIQPKEIRQITIEFAPNAGGLRTALLEFDSTVQKNPFMVDFSGTGKETPEVELNFNSHNYGRVYVSFSKSFNFEISNKGTGDLSITQFAFTGPNASDFTITAGNAPVTVHSEYSHPTDFKHIFTVEYAPLAAGQSAATLEITHGAVGSPTQVTLEGTAEDPFSDLTVDPSSHTFGGVSVGSHRDQEFEIESTGVIDLNISNIEIIAGTSTEYSIESVVNDGTPVTSAPYACTVIVGKICIVTVRFSPTIKGSGKTSTLKLTHDAASSPTDIAIDGGTGYPVMINECEMGVNDYVEIYNVGTSQVDISGWKLEIWYLRSGNNTRCGIYTFPPGSSIPASGVKTCPESSKPGDYPIGFNIMWIGSDGGEAILWDNNANGIDYMYFNMSTPQHIPSNLTWNGSSVPNRGEVNHYRNSNSNTYSANDWSYRPSSPDYGAKNPGQ